MPSQRLAHITATLEAEKQNITEELKQITDTYWAIWRKTNGDIVTQRRGGDGSRKQGSLAPTVRVRNEGDGGAVSVRWRVYENNYARLNLAEKSSLTFANEMTRKKNGLTSTSALMNKAQKWERELIEEILKQLNPLIMEMNAVHEALKKIKAVERQLSKTAENQEA